MIGFYGLLDGNKARTEVLPSAIPRALPIYRSVNIYRLSAITLNCLFGGLRSSALALYLLSMTCVCNSLSFKEDSL